MANRSFLLCQRWLKNVFPSLSMPTISLPAFSNHFLYPSTATVFSLFHEVGADFSPRFTADVSRSFPTIERTVFL
ncbi:unnamed protein product [Ectocarpus sp. 8 AP-2014]